MAFQFLECLKCSNDSIPVYGLYFTKWFNLPKEITASCEYLTSGIFF